MRSYELAYIVDPDLDEAGLREIEQKIQGWIEAAGGKIEKVDRWGRRRLAYPIKKRNDGYYIFVQAALPPQAGTQIERDLRLNESILRYLITLQETA